MVAPMPRSATLLLFVLVAGPLATLALPEPAGPVPVPGSTVAADAVQGRVGAVPGATDSASGLLYFEPNVGQAAPQVRYLARSGLDVVAGVTDDALLLPAGIELSFGGIGTEAETVLASSTRAYLGRDASAWTEGAHAGRLRMATDAGIDVVLRGDGQGRLEFDHILAPGADPTAARFEVAGSTAVVVEPDGGLRIGTADGGFGLAAPQAYQDTPAGRVAVAATFLVEGSTVGYRVGAFDPGLPLVIDPVLRYSSFLGMWQREHAGDIAVADLGMPDQREIAIAGQIDDITSTGGVVYPFGWGASPNLMHGPGGSYDGFVATFRYDLKAHTMKPVWIAYFGGGSTEGAGNGGEGVSVDMDPSGRVLVAGATGSSNFPILDPVIVTGLGGTVTYDGSVKQGQYDGFVLYLDPSGGLLMSTLLGGDTEDVLYDARFLGGDLLVVGESRYPTATATGDAYPTVNAFQPNQATPGNGGDAVITRIKPGAGAPSSLVFSTFLGGNGGDKATSVDLDAGAIHLAGMTSTVTSGSTKVNTFPVTAGAYMEDPPGSTEIFVARMPLDGSGLDYATFLGGTSVEYTPEIAVDGAGRPWIFAHTLSTDFPVCTTGGTACAPGAPPAMQPANSGGNDLVLAQLDATASQLLYSTYLGGTASDLAEDLWLEPVSGHLGLFARTYSSGLPVTRELISNRISTMSFDADHYIARFDPATNTFWQATYLGGSDGEEDGAIVIDRHWNVFYAAGTYEAVDYPLASPIQGGNGGSKDAVLGVIGKVAPNATLTASASGYASVSTPATSAYKVLTFTDVSFDALLSTDGDFPIDPALTEWSMTGGAAPVTSLGATPSFSPHQLKDNGTRKVCVTVWDSDPYGQYDRNDTACLEVEWLNRPPVAAFGVAPQAVAGKAVLFTDASTDVDGAVVKWAWDFGDGTTATGAKPSHAFTKPGSYNVTLTVTDDDGATDTYNETVSVAWGPTADFTVKGPVYHGVKAAFNDTSLAGDLPLVNWTWDFGDGSAPTKVLSPAAADLDHLFPGPGTYAVRLTVDDGVYEDDHLIDVTVLNPGVTASGDTYAVLQDTGLTVTVPGVLGNDAQAAGTGLTVSSWTPPSAGTLTMHGNGSFAYTPKKGFTGTDHFTYAVTDGAVTVDQVPVDITVSPFAPPTAKIGMQVSGHVAVFEDRSVPGSRPIVDWAWTFDDGTASGTRHPVHAFARGGTHDVALTVTDDVGLSSTAYATVYLPGHAVQPEPGSDAPRADAGPDTTVAAGSTVLLDGTGSLPPLRDLRYRWTQTSGPPVRLTADDAPRPAFLAPIVDARVVLGFDLLVYDGVMESVSDHVAVTVEPRNRAPEARLALGLLEATAGEEVTLDASASRDPDGDALVHRWTQVAGPEGRLTGGGSAVASWTAPDVAAPVTAAFRIEVHDGVRHDAALLQVHLVPAPAAAAARFTVHIDPGDPLLVRFDDEAAAAARAWHYGDGTAVDHRASPTHRFGLPGTYLVRLVVTDDQGRADEIRRLVTVGQDASPAAAADMPRGAAGALTPLPTGPADAAPAEASPASVRASGLGAGALAAAVVLSLASAARRRR